MPGLKLLLIAACATEPLEPTGPAPDSGPQTSTEDPTTVGQTQPTTETGTAPEDTGFEDSDTAAPDVPSTFDDGQSRLVLRINEVVADNRLSATDETGAAPDWLELYNLTDADLPLDGYRINDDEDPEDAHLLDGLVLPANGYLLLWADGLPKLGPDHLPFSISNDGENLAVFAPGGGLLDLVELPPQARDLALQRFPDGADAWRYTYRVTPGAPNGPMATETDIAVPPDSPWRYLDGGDSPGVGWTDPGYDDSGWSEGPGPLGYGDAHQVTVLDYGPNPNDKALAYYFRSTVEIVDVDDIVEASLGVLRDDGVIVYLNGVEVLRNNMAKGAVTPETLASATVAEAEDSYLLAPIDPSLLVEGLNTLAAEVHQAAPTSSDLGFDLYVSLERLVPTVDGDGSDLSTLGPLHDRLDPRGGALAGDGSLAVDHVPAAVPPPLPEPLESHVFDDFAVHQIAFEVDSASYSALIADSRTYAPATFITEDAEFPVAIRVKGNVTWRPITEKPSLKLQFDMYDEDRQYWGLSAVNLHNMTYDPSFLAESLSYWVYREAGWPAPRTSYAEVTINGEYRGLYAIIEEKNKRFLEHWLEDGTGSVWEAGSFNWGCDVNDFGCDCFEHDHEGAGDAIDDLEQLCRDATTPDPAAWLSVMQTRLDWDAFLGTLTTDMALAHWDSYGYNWNNYHLIHEPSTGQWTWTPWSTDLAFGWNPWDPGWCGDIGTNPSDYDNYGYVISRCMGTEACMTELEDAMLATADHIDALDVAGRIDALDALASAYPALEPYPWYSASDQVAHATCIAGFMAQRPDYLRTWAGSP